jgi:hypothetical protein
LDGELTQPLHAFNNFFPGEGCHASKQIVFTTLKRISAH